MSNGRQNHRSQLFMPKTRARTASEEFKAWLAVMLVFGAVICFFYFNLVMWTVHGGSSSVITPLAVVHILCYYPMCIVATVILMLAVSPLLKGRRNQGVVIILLTTPLVLHFMAMVMSSL